MTEGITTKEGFRERGYLVLITREGRGLLSEEGQEYRDRFAPISGGVSDAG